MVGGEMNFNWQDIGVISALLGAGFTVVSYIVRTAERSLRLEVGELKRRLDKMDTVLEKLVDFNAQLLVLNERFSQQGKRQDEVDRRINDLSRRLGVVADRHWKETARSDE